MGGLGAFPRRSVHRIKRGFLIWALVTVVVGCGSTPIQPLNPRVQRPLTPTADSIRELLQVVHADDIAGEGVAAARSAIETGIEAKRPKRSYSPAQQQVIDEFIQKVLALIDETLNIDRIEDTLATVIHDHFSQQDVDSLTSFYRTKAGQALVTKAPAAFRAAASGR